MKTDDEPEDLGSPTVSATLEVRLPIEIKKAEYTIFELHRRWRQKTLVLDPDFQREFVWPIDKQIKLVESVMARIPLPVFYLSDETQENTEDQILVVDGQQRLTTLFAFMEGRYADPSRDTPIVTRDSDLSGRPFVLNKLRLMKELEGKTFSTLDLKLRRRFEETSLVCFVIQPKTSPEVKFELFERINAESTQLNAQEIRNALYRGSGLDLVRRLARAGSDFRRVAGEGRIWNRMRADEFVLRGVSFLWRGTSDYSGDLKLFLNDTLVALNKALPEELAQIEARFLHAVAFAERVFGEHAWQRFVPQKDEFAGHISGPLVEAVSAVADRLYRDELPEAKLAKGLKHRFRHLCSDADFVGAILNATQTKRNLTLRITQLEEAFRADQPAP